MDGRKAMTYPHASRRQLITRLAASLAAVLFAASAAVAGPVAAHTAVPAHAMTSGWWSGDQPVTQPWGCTDFTGEPYDPRYPSCAHFHQGIDIGFPTDCYSTNYVIYAGRNGTIVQIGGESYYGSYYPVLRTPDGHDIILAHVRASLVSVGQAVSIGTPLAYVGSEGFSTGCHLHFEVRPAGGGYGTSIDPTPFLASAVTPACWPYDSINVVYTDWNKSTSQWVYDSWGGGSWHNVAADLWSYRYSSSDGDCYRGYYASVWTNDGSGCYCQAHLRVWNHNMLLDSPDSGNGWGNRNQVVSQGPAQLWVTLPSGAGGVIGFFDYGRNPGMDNPDADNSTTNAYSPTWNIQPYASPGSGFWLQLY